MNQLSLDFSAPKKPELPPGAKRVARVLRDLEALVITDTIAAGPELMTSVEGNPTSLRLHHNDVAYRLHPNAFTQLCNRLRVPSFYITRLLNEPDWGQKLAILNLDELFFHRCKDLKFLLRSVDGTIRGFLSNAYKRLDSVRLINEFSTYAGAAGAVPHDALLSDLHVCVIAAKPDKWQIGDLDIRFGVVFKNSEFGVGRAEVQLYMDIGGLATISDNGVCHTHRGRRLTNDVVANTAIYDRDNESLAKAIGGHISQHLSPSNLDLIKTELLLREKKEVKFDEVEALLQNLPLLENEVEQAALIFRDTTNTRLPQRFTQMRLAAAIAWVADTCSDPAQKLNLMQVAGKVLLP